MRNHEDLVSVSERLEILEKRLRGLEHRDLHRWDRELLSAGLKGLIKGLVHVETPADDLRSVGIDPTPGRSLREFDRHGVYDELRSLPGGGYWHKHFDDCVGNADFGYNLPGFYLPPDQAAKVNSHRARKYLESGGTLEQAEQHEGCWGFEPKFVAAVRAMTISYLWLLALSHLRRKLGGISAFLILTAMGTIAADLRTGFAAGLLGWLLASLVFRRLHKRLTKPLEQAHRGEIW